jgi:hypothetical protein
LFKRKERSGGGTNGLKNKQAPLAAAALLTSIFDSVAVIPNAVRNLEQIQTHLELILRQIYNVKTVL